MARLQLAADSAAEARATAPRGPRRRAATPTAPARHGHQLDDTVEVVTARRRVDEVLARLVAQPFDEAAMADLDRWRQDCLPAARAAWARLRAGGSGPFQIPEAGEVTPVAGVASPSRVSRPRVAGGGA